MGDYISILLVCVGFFAAVMVLLTADPKISKRLTAAAGILALIGGLSLYGYGYIATAGTVLEAMLRTVFAVCRMFIGEADFGDISEAPLFAMKWLVTLCWCSHVLAFYATSSAALSLIGANALRKLRLRLAVKRDLNILFGVHEDSVSFGQNLTEEHKQLAVYVAEEAEESLSDAIGQSGGVLYTGSKAASGSVSFLKSLGLASGKRCLTVYCLHKDPLKNMTYARDLLDSCRQLGIDPSRLSLVILAREDETVQELQVADGRYGYGFITVFRENDLTARLLIRHYPPCDSVSFDDRGRATEDFEALIVGFGSLGQRVLRSLIMNGQFVGSTFRADVFDPQYRDRDGYFRSRFPGVLEQYRVHFHTDAPGSRGLYDHLTQRLDSLRYIVLCADTEQENEALAQDIGDYLAYKGVYLPIYQCSCRGVKTTCGKTGQTREYIIYDPAVLSTRSLDQLAMTVNHYYQGAGSRGPLREWMACDYFSRMSNRAYADFQEAVLRAAGKTREDALAGRWEFTPAHKENLGRMEHLRWNAFHFCMGFTPMDPETYDRRAEIYLQEKAQTGKGKIRIGKDMQRKEHACLISWEALNALSAKENAITGGSVDYQQMDINNIDLLPKLLQIQEQQNR